MKKYLHILKILTAAVLFIAPCALYFIFLRSKLSGDELLYSYSGALWVLTPLSGIAACIALHGEHDETEIHEDEEYDTYAEPEDSIPESSEAYIEEYSELYRSTPAETEEVPVKCPPDITAAISMQKAEINEDESDGDVRDDIWEDFVGDAGSAKSYDDIYNDLPDTLPEGFSFHEEDEEENEDGEEYPSEPDISLLPVIRIAAAAVCAVCIVVSVILSGAYVAASDGGVTVGKRSYSWSDTEKLEISPSSLGDGLRVVAYMNDGKKVTVCSDSMFAGKASNGVRGDIKIYAHICSLARSGGASVSVHDRKSIESSFGDSDEWELVAEMIGEAE